MPLVAAMIVAHKDNVGINLTTPQVVVTHLDVEIILVEAPHAANPPRRRLAASLRMIGIFNRAEPSNFAVPQPSFGRSC